jgi:hypothetical protein
MRHELEGRVLPGRLANPTSGPRGDESHFGAEGSRAIVGRVSALEIRSSSGSGSGPWPFATLIDAPDGV